MFKNIKLESINYKHNLKIYLIGTFHFINNFFLNIFFNYIVLTLQLYINILIDNIRFEIVVIKII